MTKLWLLLLACALPAQQVTLPTEAVIFGDEFEITVTASDAFDPGQLSPLVVELLDRTAIGARQTWRFRARCYQVGEVTLALNPPAKLMVATSLPEPAGGLEWPSDGWLMTPGSSGLWPWMSLLGAGVILAWWLRSYRAAKAEPAMPAVADRGQEWDAMAALKELLPPGSGSYQPYYQQLKAIVRRHCHVRFLVAADVRTSEELLQTLPDLEPPLKVCLNACDVALFGGDLGHRQDHQDAKTQAIAFVSATRSDATAGKGAAQ
jgi:hypothetical protein